MFLSILLAALASQQSFVGRPSLQCAGGATIFFTRGSAEIDTEAANRLEGFVFHSRWIRVAGFVSIEADGDGTGNQFNAVLSRRRSEAIRAFLQRRGYEVREMNVVVGERQGWGGDDGSAATVAVLVPNDEYQRRFPGAPFECF